MLLLILLPAIHTLPPPSSHLTFKLACESPLLAASANWAALSWTLKQKQYKHPCRISSLHCCRLCIKHVGSSTPKRPLQRHSCCSSCSSSLAVSLCAHSQRSRWESRRRRLQPTTSKGQPRVCETDLALGRGGTVPPSGRMDRGQWGWPAAKSVRLRWEGKTRLDNLRNR